MAGKSPNRLRLESLEDRWNLSTLEPLALAAPAPGPVAVQQEFFTFKMTDVLVSNINIGNQNSLSGFGYTWGQFLDHDMD
jgi:hypothetical protein